MIDHFTIFTKGGVVLWSRELNPVPGRPVDALVQDVLMEEKSAQSSFSYDTHTLKWLFDNELDLVFVAVYLNLTQLFYIDDLLKAAKREFVKLYGKELTASLNGQPLPPTHFRSFDQRFDDILGEFERQSVNSRARKPPRKFEATKKGQELINPMITTTQEKKQREEEAKKKAEEAKKKEEEEKARFEEASRALLERKAMKGPRGKPIPRKSTKKDTTAESGTTTAPAKRVKKMQTWVGEKVDVASLDRSAPVDAAALEAKRAEESSAMGEMPSAEDFESDEESESDQEEEESESKNLLSEEKNQASSGFMGFLKRMTGNSTLTAEDLAPVLENFRQLLMSKNVAAHIAEELCQSVGASLQGKRAESFTTIKTIVKNALEEALGRILTPSKPVDVMQGIMLAKQEKRPYSIVFVGVNGVGKSTSLSKIAAYFLSKNLTVSIAACDTFRSGAIEQLRTHARRLNVEVFDKGYDRDAASVAMDGIYNAKKKGHDVVLIDTAGRMQDNDPLMKALAKLIHVNKPDLVLFVGEALVGNDGVDQLVKFNRALADLSETTRPRLIDGIVLTKFDTIDDKVGAAISMTYTTSIPIVFVGCGQSYRDLKQPNVKTFIRALLK